MTLAISTKIHSASAVLTAEGLVPSFARNAAIHDRDNSFVADNYTALKAAGLVRAAVPLELGGGGAEVRELAEMLRTLAHGCGSTALAFAMHTHQVAIPAWRWRHRPETRPVTEPLLLRIAGENIVIATSGGSDWIGGSGRAEKVEGGYRIHARKIFASSSPVADIFMTSAIADEDGASKVLHFGLPMSSPQIKVLDTWDCLGMRGTGSHDIEIDGAFVPNEKVALKRPAGVWHPLFQIIGTIAFPLIYSVYLGVAESAAALALETARRKPADARQRRLAGHMETELAAAGFAREAMVAEAERNEPGEISINRVMIGRRLVEQHAIRAVELAMELAGGVGFYRGSGLERHFRDIQGARYHPMLPEVQYEYAGALALGQPVANIY